MLECDYIVKQIDGDYAHLQRVDQPEAELKLVARALLPADIYEGCELHYAMMQYSISSIYPLKVATSLFGSIRRSSASAMEVVQTSHSESNFP